MYYMAGNWSWVWRCKSLNKPYPNTSKWQKGESDAGSRDHISDWKCLDSNSLQTMENLPIFTNGKSLYLRVSSGESRLLKPQSTQVCAGVFGAWSIMLEDLHNTELWENLKIQMFVADAFSRVISPCTLDGENFWAKVLIS